VTGRRDAGLQPLSLEAPKIVHLKIWEPQKRSIFLGGEGSKMVVFRENAGKNFDLKQKKHPETQWKSRWWFQIFFIFTSFRVFV